MPRKSAAELEQSLVPQGEAPALLENGPPEVRGSLTTCHDRKPIVLPRGLNGRLVYAFDRMDRHLAVYRLERQEPTTEAGPCSRCGSDRTTVYHRTDEARFCTCDACGHQWADRATAVEIDPDVLELCRSVADTLKAATRTDGEVRFTTIEAAELVDRLREISTRLRAA